MIELWKKNDTFKKSLEQSKAAKRPAYTFYDGPPFATGLPHYGHLLAGSVKDIVTRYKLNQHILMRSLSSFEYIFVQNIKLLEVFTFHTRLVFTFHTLIVMEVPRLQFTSTSYYKILNTVLPRYAHQNGYHVERRFGWDCHGLPVEHEIDKKLGAFNIHLTKTCNNNAI